MFVNNEIAITPVTPDGHNGLKQMTHRQPHERVGKGTGTARSRSMTDLQSITPYDVSS
jgi:hypothetical protein